MAKAFGGYGGRLTDPARIMAAIRRGIEQTQAGKPVLLEFITAKETRFRSSSGLWRAFGPPLFASWRADPRDEPGEFGPVNHVFECPEPVSGLRSTYALPTVVLQKRKTGRGQRSIS